jgi:hypothetical protein
MSVSITGQTVYSGSIFYFDTNNVKSYVGEPTTNRNQQISNYTGTNYADGSHGGEWSSNPTRFSKTYTASIATPIGFGATLCSETATAGYYHLSSMGGDSESGAHSISCYIYPLSSITNFTIGMLGDSGNTVTFNFTTGAITYGGSISNRNAFMSTVVGFPGWYRVGANIEGRAGGWVGCLGLDTYTSYTPSAPYKSFYITGMQYEYKDHCTPYVFGTRSATQGLLDLTSRNTIDLTDMSYNSSSAVFTFDGVNDYINTNVPAQTLTNGTIEAWVYDTKNNSGYRAIVQFNVNTDDALYIYPSNVLGFWPCAASSLTVPSNTWVHVAVAYNGSQLLYSVNGVTQEISTTCADFTDLQYVKIGGHSTGDGERWQGNITEVKVYNRALSRDEILKNYNRSKARYGR